MTPSKKIKQGDNSLGHFLKEMIDKIAIAVLILGLIGGISQLIELQKRLSTDPWHATSFQEARAQQKCEEEGYTNWVQIYKNSLVVCGYRIAMEPQELSLTDDSYNFLDFSDLPYENMMYETAYDSGTSTLEWNESMKGMIRRIFGRNRSCTFESSGFVCEGTIK